MNKVIINKGEICPTLFINLISFTNVMVEETYSPIFDFENLEEVNIDV